jgi:hypothetical protein
LRRAAILAATAFLLIFAGHARADAQTRPGDAPARSARPAPARTQGETPSSADEDFELNIDQRRINEGEYHAETAVSTEGARGLQLNVGVALSASEIDVLLRNVRGRVRFRASLDPVLRLLDARREASPRSPPAATPP